MAQTHSEAQAARLRYPLGVCGYSPNERAYWFDPGLDWINRLLNPVSYGLDPEVCAQQLAGLDSLPGVWNENMAPRFITGTYLAGRKLHVGDPLVPGDVVQWLEPGEALDCPTLARVVSVEPTRLRLACDNGGHPYQLPWGPGAELPPYCYRVTHYISRPLDEL